MTNRLFLAQAASAFGLLAWAAAPAIGNPQPAAGRGTIQATAGDLFRLAESFVQNGKADRAAPILDLLAEDPNPDVRNEARFRLAMLDIGGKRLSSAAVHLRAILDQKPDAHRARLELAGVLQKLGHEELALRQLRALRSVDLPPTVARFVDRLSASLQASKPLGFHIEAALAPDSNINRATRSDTLGTVIGDFTIDQKARSGVGATVRGMANVRVPFGDRLNLVGRASSDSNLYRDKDFNEISLDAATGLGLGLGRTRLGAEIGAGQTWYGMKPYQRGLRLSGNVTRAIGPVSQLRLDASARLTDNRVNDLQDGRGLTARLRFERALSPRLMVSASAAVDRFKAEDDAYSTRSWVSGVTLYREMGRMTLTAGVEVGGVKADERLSLLPERREDKLTRLHFGAVLRQFTVAGFAPMARLVVERNRSTVEFYDYKRTRTEVGISRAF